METTIEHWGCIRIMETKMETTIEYWGYIRIVGKKMETAIVYCWVDKPMVNPSLPSLL